MLKFTRVLSIIMVIAFLSSATVFAEVLTLKKKAITVTKATGTIKLDGKDREYSWKKARNMASTINHTIITRTKAVVNGQPAGCAKVTTLKYLWSKKALYVFITIKDKTLYSKGFESIQFDSVEYHIDAKNCDRASYNGICDEQYRLSRPYKGTDKKIHTDVTRWGKVNIIPAFTKNSKSIGTSTSYTQEVKIVLAHHGVANLKAKQKVGFDIQINDATATKAGRTFQLIWNSLDNAWINPSTMGTLIMK